MGVDVVVGESCVTHGVRTQQRGGRDAVVARLPASTDSSRARATPRRLKQSP